MYVAVHCRRARPLFGAILGFGALLAPAQAAVVNSTSLNPLQSGATTCVTGFLNSENQPECTMNAAIALINGDPLAQRFVSFNIPTSDPRYDAASGAFTILGGFPVITRNITIDGYSQPGASENTLSVGSDAILKIVTSRLTLRASDSFIRGLVSIGIVIDGASRTVIEGNYIGIDASGTVSRSVTGTGIILQPSSVTAVAGQDNVIGGPAPADRNVISGFAGVGIRVCSACQADTIRNNYIGTTAAGNAALGITGGPGIWVEGADGTLIRDNVVSGNDEDGIRIFADNSVVHGNIVGATAAGTGNLSNRRQGIRIQGSGNRIGGTAPGEGNLVANNRSEGVLVSGSTSMGNAIRGNRIFASNRLGIDLAGGGRTNNDAGDADTGTNGLQNYPVLGSAVADGVNNTSVQGTLDSVASAQFDVDIFASTVCDPSGWGEGEDYLGSFIVNTDTGGIATFADSTLLPTSKRFITATATDKDGNTSEFSACLDASTDSPGTLQFSAADYVVDEDATDVVITVTRSGGLTGRITVDYATSDGTAVAGTDYQPASGTLVFESGDANQDFSVSPINDIIRNLDKTVTLTLSNPSNPPLGIPRTATLTIQDDDPDPAAEFVTGALGGLDSVAEDSGPATITVELSAAAEIPVSVEYMTADRNATAGANYVMTSGQLDFTPGQRFRSFDIPITNDSLLEGTEGIAVTLLNPVNATVPPAPARLSILDDDDGPAVIEFAETFRQDTDSTLTLRLVRVWGDTRSVTVRIEPDGGTAQQGVDYFLAGQDVTLDHVDQVKEVPIAIIPDGPGEGTETAFFRLTNPGGGATLGARDVMRLDIPECSSGRSDCRGDIMRLLGKDAVVEGDSTDLLLQSSRIPDRFFTRDLMTTALEDIDYVSIDEPGGSTVTLTTLDDGLAEGTETVEIVATQGGTEWSTLVSLHDDEGDPGQVAFATRADSLTFRENSGLVSIPIVRLGGSEGTVHADYLVGDDSNDVEWVRDGKGKLTFLDGQTEKQIQLRIFGDDNRNRFTRSFFLYLANPTGGASLHPTRARLEIFIEDDELMDVEDCPIDFAFMGSPFSSNLDSLRQFRDQVLSPTAAGRWLIGAYYGASDAVISLMLLDDSTRMLVFLAGILAVVAVENPAAVLTLTALTGLLVIGRSLRRRRRRSLFQPRLLHPQPSLVPLQPGGLLRWTRCVPATTGAWLACLLLLPGPGLAAPGWTPEEIACAERLGVRLDRIEGNPRVSLQTLAWVSDLIVRGTVEQATFDGKKIVASVDIDTVLAGTPPSSTITVLNTGLRPDHVRWDRELGAPAFRQRLRRIQEGQEVILFLVSDPRAGSDAFVSVLPGRYVIIEAYNQAFIDAMEEQIDHVVQQKEDACAGLPDPAGVTFVSAAADALQRLADAGILSVDPAILALLATHAAEMDDLLLRDGDIRARVRVFQGHAIGSTLARLFSGRTGSAGKAAEEIDNLRALADRIRSVASPELSQEVDALVARFEQHTDKLLPEAVLETLRQP